MCILYNKNTCLFDLILHICTSLKIINSQIFVLWGERNMLIRWATQSDKPAWVLLAENVAHIFGNVNMPTDDDFHEYMDGKLSKYEALIAVDRMTNECLGIVGFSRTFNRITWFGVFEKHRGKGIGTMLMKCALNQLDSSKEMTVETYRDDFPLGAPARKVYHKVGFLDVDNTIFDHLGNPRCKMVIAPSEKKRGGSFHYKFPQYAKWAKEKNAQYAKVWKTLILLF